MNVVNVRETGSSDSDLSMHVQHDMSLQHVKHVSFLGHFSLAGG